MEGALEAADWACRATIYEEHLDDVEREISTFAEEHAAQIADAVIAWGDVQERARDLPKS